MLTVNTWKLVNVYSETNANLGTFSTLDLSTVVIDATACSVCLSPVAGLFFLPPSVLHMDSVYAPELSFILSGHQGRLKRNW